MDQTFITLKNKLQSLQSELAILQSGILKSKTKEITKKSLIDQIKDVKLEFSAKFDALKIKKEECEAKLEAEAKLKDPALQAESAKNAALKSILSELDELNVEKHHAEDQFKNELHELEVKLIEVKGKIIEYEKKLNTEDTSEVVSKLESKKSEEKALINQINEIKSQLITMSNEFETRKNECEASLQTKIDAILNKPNDKESTIESSNESKFEDEKSEHKNVKPTYLEVARRALESDKKGKSDSKAKESDVDSLKSEQSLENESDEAIKSESKNIDITQYELQSIKNELEIRIISDKKRAEIKAIAAEKRDKLDTKITTKQEAKVVELRAEIDKEEQIELDKVEELRFELEAEAKANIKAKEDIVMNVSFKYINSHFSNDSSSEDETSTESSEDSKSEGKRSEAELEPKRDELEAQHSEKIAEAANAMLKDKETAFKHAEFEAKLTKQKAELEAHRDEYTKTVENAQAEYKLARLDIVEESKYSAKRKNDIAKYNAELAEAKAKHEAKRAEDRDKYNAEFEAKVAELEIKRDELKAKHDKSKAKVAELEAIAKSKAKKFNI